MYHQIIAICCQTVKMLLPSCCQAIKLSSMLSSALLSTSAPKSTTFHQASISTRVTSIKSPNHKLVTGVFKIFVCGQSPKGMKWILNPNLVCHAFQWLIESKFFKIAICMRCMRMGQIFLLNARGKEILLTLTNKKLERI